jgi:hypothetical protein
LAFDIVFFNQKWPLPAKAAGRGQNVYVAEKRNNLIAAEFISAPPMRLVA